MKVTDFDLVLVNAIVTGVEVAGAVGFAFVPPLLLKSGYTETQMSIIFGLGKETPYKDLKLTTDPLF